MNASISGCGTINGGTYNEVTVSGSGKITGDIVANSLRISGSGKVEGKVDSKEIRISGAASLLEDVKAENLSVSGAVKFIKNIEAENGKISGAITVNGDAYIDNLKAVCDNCKFNGIYGDSIEIECNRQSIVEEIEATTLKLTNLTCRRVSGQNVTIGSNCDIDVVEYSDSLIIYKNARIKKIIKL